MQNIAPPKVIFPNFCNIISYKASTFPHFIYNYSDISIVFTEKNKLKVYPAGKTIGTSKFDWFGKYLKIGNNKILVTGGGDGNEGLSSYFILNVASKQISQVANLKRKDLNTQ